MAALGSVGVLLPGVRTLLSNQHEALSGLVWAHRKRAMRTNPAATEQDSILFLRRHTH